MSYVSLLSNKNRKSKGMKCENQNLKREGSWKLKAGSTELKTGNLKLNRITESNSECSMLDARSLRFFNLQYSIYNLQF